jgi:polyisoprenoid-binding protein YceI
MGHIKNLGGWAGSMGFVGALTVAAAVSGCMGELKPGTLHPTEQAAVSAAAAGAPMPAAAAAAAAMSKIRFSMDKWMDAQGMTTAAVSGAFTRFSVDLDQTMDLERLVGASASVTIDVTSLDTGSEPRDVNIEESYFETNLFTTATVDFLVTESSAAGSPDGGDTGEVNVRADASLTLHGTTASLGSIELLVSRVAEGIRVRTKQPIAIRSTSFSMPVAALLARCGHYGIAEAAMVEADVVVPH